MLKREFTDQSPQIVQTGEVLAVGYVTLTGGKLARREHAHSNDAARVFQPRRLLVSVLRWNCCRALQVVVPHVVGADSADGNNGGACWSVTVEIPGYM